MPMVHRRWRALVLLNVECLRARKAETHHCHYCFSRFKIATLCIADVVCPNHSVLVGGLEQRHDGALLTAAMRIPKPATVEEAREIALGALVTV